MEDLIRYGSLDDIIAHFKGKTRTDIRNDDDIIIKLLCKYGRLDVLKWIQSVEGVNVEVGVIEPWNYAACAYAGQFNRMDILEWLKSIGSHIPRLANYWAAEGGHINILEWFEKENSCYWGPEVYDQAARGGHLHVIQWLLERGIPHDEKASEGAARGGHFELLKWLVENNFTISPYIIWRASYSGNNDIIRWARDKGYSWDSNTTDGIARRGDLDMLKWVRDPIAQGGIENICPIDASACQKAAHGGHFSTLKWLRANGCPWNHMTMLSAIYAKNLEMIKWIRDPVEQGGVENTLALDAHACFNASRPGQLDILEYLHDECKWYDWECKEGRCQVCNTKKSIVKELTEETGSYFDWLSIQIIRDIN